ncbi:MAG: hypothetical protein LCH79_16150 [Proteobacteria bacterium]|nr:hypothetical protein [Pseudomonadota bacterium]
MPTLRNQAGVEFEYSTLQQGGAAVLLDGQRWVEGRVGMELQIVGAAPASLPLTKRAFQNRFPKTADGISTKYDAMTLFLSKDSYAATLVEDDEERTALQLLITTGLNRINASAFVDLALTEAANFTGLLLQPGIPAAFRLSLEERAAILNPDILPGERYDA